MKTFTFYIQPLRQLWIVQDVLYKPKDVKSIDQLNKDLSYKKTLASYDDLSPREALKKAIADGVVSEKGWTKVEADANSSPEDLWPQAMEKLSGQTEDLS